jgi:hypothetical protein
LPTITHVVTARRLLKSMSVKQGIKYDSPESRLEIPTFIAFHNLNTNEILDPIDSFRASVESLSLKTTNTPSQKHSTNSSTENSNLMPGPLQTQKTPADSSLARIAG